MDTERANDAAAHALGEPEVEAVQHRLEQRFPDVDADEIVAAIDDAVEETADAKIQTFRPLLVEHHASNELLEDHHTGTHQDE